MFVLLSGLLLTSCVTTADVLTLDTSQQKTATEPGEVVEGEAVANLTDAKISEAPVAAPVEVAVSDVKPGDTPEPQVADVAESKPTSDSATKPQGFLSAFFGGAAVKATAEEDGQAHRKDEPSPKPIAQSAPAPVTKTDSAPLVPKDNGAVPPSKPAIQAFAMDALPGVRPREQLFDIIRHNGGDSDDDIDLYEDAPRFQLAGAAGLARLAPNGLRKQGDHVDTSCFKPQLVRMIKQIERHFGKPAVITSGYRNAAYNKKVRGASKSLHMSCDAADIHVAGINKFELARFARGLPGRGGVGTYCHTTTVHVDVGPSRDWNWRCPAK